MKFILFVAMLAVIVVLAIALYGTRLRLRTANALAGIDELELEISPPDTHAMRQIIISTPKEALKDSILMLVRALRDSADLLRDDLMATYDTVSLAQEHEIDHLRRHASELETLAFRISSGETHIDRQRVNLYRWAVLTYGAASFVTHQLRSEVGVPSLRPRDQLR